MHILTAGQGVDGSTQVLYKKQGGSSGFLGGGSFGAVHLEIRDSECEAVPRVRAVKSISKEAAESSKVHWQQEVQNLPVLSEVIMIVPIKAVQIMLICCAVPESVREDIWLVGR